MREYLRAFIQGPAIAVFCCLSPNLVNGDWTNTLEHTEHWAAGTAITQNDLCSGDISGDGETEIVALSTTTVDGRDHAELRIARWDGSDYTILAEQFWTIDSAPDVRSRGVGCAELVPFGGLDVATGIQTAPGVEPEAELRVWHWNAADGSLVEARAPLTFPGGIGALAVADADGDGMPEILTGGSSSGSGAEMRIFHVADDRLVQEHAVSWPGGEVRGLAVADVDADGEPEIVTARALSGAAEAIELRIWQWDGSAMTVEAETIWDAGDDTSATNLAVGNVDADALLEIVVVGTLTDTDVSHPQFGVVSLWERDGDTLEIQDYRAWQSAVGNVEYFGTAMADIDGDSVDEIVVAGALHEDPPQNILRVYEWDSGRLHADYSEEWIAPGMHGNFTYVVDAADVDSDTQVEMVTGGRALSAEGSHHQMTIWQLEWSLPSVFWGWLDDLKQVFAWEGWPLYGAFRDTIPWPWSAVAYTGFFLVIGAFAGYGLWRARLYFKRDRKP
jgi:hypothetical protein